MVEGLAWRANPDLRGVFLVVIWLMVPPPSALWVMTSAGIPAVTRNIVDLAQLSRVDCVGYRPSVTVARPAILSVIRRLLRLFRFIGQVPRERILEVF